MHIRNANTAIGHNIAFLKNTFRIDIVNNEITSLINLPTVQLTIDEHVLLSNLKMLIVVRNEDATLVYLTIYHLMIYTV